MDTLTVIKALNKYKDNLDEMKTSRIVSITEYKTIRAKVKALKRKYLEVKKKIKNG